jgi:hypothetical protein
MNGRLWASKGPRRFRWPDPMERFQAKWRPVRVKKTRQINNLEPRFDSIEAEKALETGDPAGALVSSFQAPAFISGYPVP